MLRRVPNKPRLSSHNFRVRDDEWAAAMRSCEEHGENISDHLREAVAKLARRKPPNTDKDAANRTE